MDALGEHRADGTALAGTFDHKEPLVDLSDGLHELEPGAKAQVGRFVDDGLDAQGPPFFPVLLHPRVLVGEVHVDFAAE